MSVFKKILLSILLVMLFAAIGCNAQNDDTHNKVSKCDSWDVLKKYIGTYANFDGFFEDEIVKAELERILRDDYDSYLKHLKASGSGKTMELNGLIYGDVSQHSVGGYSSIFFVDVENTKMYLFWLKERVKDGIFEIYGDRPLPKDVLTIIVDEMNTSWDHVATFSIVEGNLVIKMNR